MLNEMQMQFTKDIPDAIPDATLMGWILFFILKGKNANPKR